MKTTQPVALISGEVEVGEGLGLLLSLCVSGYLSSRVSTLACKGDLLQKKKSFLCCFSSASPFTLSDALFESIQPYSL